MVSADADVSFADTTEVTFYELSEEDISRYIDGFKPFDKAGGYAIQEWIGLVGIESISGSYENVVGMPVARLLMEMSKMETGVEN